MKFLKLFKIKFFDMKFPPKVIKLFKKLLDPRKSWLIAINSNVTLERNIIAEESTSITWYLCVKCRDFGCLRKLLIRSTYDAKHLWHFSFSSHIRAVHTPSCRSMLMVRDWNEITFSWQRVTWLSWIFFAVER